MRIINTKKVRTVQQRKHDEDQLASPPPLEGAELRLIEREVGKWNRFLDWSSPQSLPTKVSEEGRTRLGRYMDRKEHPENKLRESHERHVGGDPAIIPRDGVYPKYVISGPDGKNMKLRQTST